MEKEGGKYGQLSRDCSEMVLNSSIYYALSIIRYVNYLYSRDRAWELLAPPLSRICLVVRCVLYKCSAAYL